MRSTLNKVFSFCLLRLLVWKSMVSRAPGLLMSDVLKAKGKGADGSWLWCTRMTQFMMLSSRNIIVQGRSSRSTKVGDIMTEENKQITVTPDTKVLIAMQLMTDNRVRHIPAIDDKEMISMVSIGFVVCAWSASTGRS
ncbi:hypothetical protein LWI29_020623 [Acer saccharum]|uniref:CBS domain-containing protein n=1 Tax=Acer saccharum TaxID=4024 RepID=A0AA39T4I9_ACESA|nr:hypothetical protein LWI29_020623 [Acer saccharum]